VLDWGVAKVIASDDDETAAFGPRHEQPAPTDMATSHEALLGTLGTWRPSS
jgi:hypothetical protein